MDVYDFTKGLDFTGFTEATAGDHNNLVDLAVPHADSANEGKGLNLWSKDSALNTPRVPDPTAGAGFAKWKRYVWIRKPDAAATVTTPISYVWDDDAVSIAVLLKWKTQVFDPTDLEAEIAAVQATADSALATANTAAASAASAQTAANAANNTANAAQSTATTALNLAQNPAGQIGPGVITAVMLANPLDLSAKTVTMPPLSITDGMLATVLNLSGKTLTLPAASVNTVLATRIFVSNAVAMSTFLPINVAHGLGSMPKWVRVVLVNINAVYGYVAGDEATLYEGVNGGVVQAGSGCSAVNVWVILNVVNPVITRKDNGNAQVIVAADWNVKVYAGI